MGDMPQLIKLVGHCLCRQRRRDLSGLLRRDTSGVIRTKLTPIVIDHSRDRLRPCNRGGRGANAQPRSKMSFVATTSVRRELNAVLRDTVCLNRDNTLAHLPAPCRNQIERVARAEVSLKDTLEEVQSTLNNVPRNTRRGEADA